MAERTEIEVKAEIAKLEEMMPRVRRYDYFGGDNHEKIRVELQVLKGELTEDDADNEEDSDLRSSMDFALEWLKGCDTDGSPSESWAILAE